MHNTSRVWTKRTQKANAFIFMTWVVVLAFVTWCFQVMTQDTIWSFALDAPRQAVDISGRMIPPNFPYINELLWPIWETINVSALAIGLLAAALLFWMKRGIIVTLLACAAVGLGLALLAP